MARDGGRLAKLFASPAGSCREAALMPVTGVCVGEEGLVWGQRQLPFAIPLYFYSNPLPTPLETT